MKPKQRGKEVQANMAKPIMITAAEICEELGVSKSFAYGLIKKLNKELDARGCITVAGKVSRLYYEQKLYGVHQN